MRILVSTDTVGASPQMCKKLPIWDFLTVLSLRPGRTARPMKKRYDVITPSFGGPMQNDTPMTNMRSKSKPEVVISQPWNEISYRNVVCK